MSHFKRDISFKFTNAVSVISDWCQSVNSTPERELYAGILTQAIKDLSNPLYSENAREWFFGEEEEPSIVPFLECCSVLGLEPESSLHRLFDSENAEDIRRKACGRKRIGHWTRLAASMKINDQVELLFSEDSRGLYQALKARNLRSTTRQIGPNRWLLKVTGHDSRI